jgi:hypothetical protein
MIDGRRECLEYMSEPEEGRKLRRRRRRIRASESLFDGGGGDDDDVMDAIFQGLRCHREGRRRRRRRRRYIRSHLHCRN